VVSQLRVTVQHKYKKREMGNCCGLGDSKYEDLDAIVSPSNEGTEPRRKRMSAKKGFENKLHQLLQKRKIWYSHFLTFLGISTWVPTDVSLWLICIDMARYSGLFVSKDINGAGLLELSIEDIKNLGVKNVTHEKLIHNEIQLLKAYDV
jgi:hypothetical protein